MTNPIKTFLILTLAIGTTITLLSYHWLLAWIGLEINTLAMIPLMSMTHHPRAYEAAVKYFLTQMAASALLLFSALASTWLFGEWTILTTRPLTSIPLSIALAMKLGMAPLHFWLPEVAQGLPLITGLIIMTWQKIAPMVLLIQISQSTNLFLMTTLGLTSILIGGWGGINQTQLRKLMAFSSISHLGWMAIILKFSPQLTMFNFVLYIILTSTFFIFLITHNTTKLSQLPTTWPKTPIYAATSALILLSLGGLPPLSGFAMKLMPCLELIKQNSLIMATLTLMFSLLPLYFYIRLLYALATTMSPFTSSPPTIWRSTTKPLGLTMLNMFSLLLLPATPAILTAISNLPIMNTS
uniref:NADH-ubiquinone oxidoreductase chain 2 n=1 Tax=Platypelis tuberifera TaxID=294374 RepID=A0A343VT93_9NEOB|nr:NADH dehydrogenase subunit 2 [Platypelis tuberifera]